MIFRTIKLGNYGIYAGTQVIEPAAGKIGCGNITLIGGLNGRGKTSLLDAVLLALYGKRTPSLREQGGAYSAYLESLIHKNAGLDAESFVELEFDAPVGSQTCHIRLRRSWRRGPRRCADRLEIWRDGIVDKHLAENWTSHVEDLLPSGLAGLFFFDGEKIAALAEADETGEGLKHSIRALLGLDLVDRLIADMGTVIRKNQSKLKNSTARREMERLQNERTSLEKRRTLLVQKIAELTTRIDQLKGKRADKEQFFYEAGGRLAQEREALRAKELELTAQIQEQKSEAAFIAGGAAPLLLVMPLLRQIQSRAARENRILEARSALRLLSERDQRLQEYVSRTIGNPEVAAAITSWAQEDRAQLERLAGEPVLYHLSAHGSAQLDRLDSLAHEIRKQAQLLRRAHDKAQIELDQVKDHLAIHVDDEEVHAALAEINELNRKIGQLEQERQALVIEKNSVQRDLDQVERQITSVASDLADVEDTERIIRYAARTQETMRAYRELATARKVGILTQHIAEAFNVLTHKTTLVSSVRMDIESLRISLHDVEGREIPKVRLSSGEKQMLAIAILWGLAKASGRTLPVIIDTPMGRLDSSHRMNFVTKYLPNASHQVIVLSTDTEIVGPYLQSLDGSIGRTYLLRYDEELQRTEVHDGYFEPLRSDAL